ncbi:MAG: hydrogenase nickel incorporation protein HypA [Desulfurococcales archaeon]|nr:hydrogenase nickel incorporation protein HypA [Desulfurococcales archaeon]
MHEWAIANAIIREVESRLKSSLGIRRLRVVLGELQNIDEGVLRQYLDMMMKEVAPEVDYDIDYEEAVFQCNRCGHTWTLKDVELSDEEREAIHFVPEAVHAYVKCPRCGSRDFKVVRGRGVRLVYEVEENA